MASERAQSEISGTCDKACEILKETNDGDLLDPSELKMTELAVNGYTGAEGREVFEKLCYSAAVNDEPLKPDELPNIAAVADKLGETHGYLHNHSLSHETLYKDFTHGGEVGRAERQSEPDYEADDGYEP